MNAWDLVEHVDDMNGIIETWTYKCKQCPNGTVEKFKACSCNWIYFIETYTHAIQLTTVCLMISLENLLGLKSKQVDITTAFVHITFGKEQKVVGEMPWFQAVQFKWKVQGSLS
ncbi:hypothetical protein ACHAXS_000902 [Conticribra weissflogii]